MLKDEKLKKKVSAFGSKDDSHELGRRSRGRTCGLPGVGFGALYRAELSACFLFFAMQGTAGLRNLMIFASRVNRFSKKSVLVSS